MPNYLGASTRTKPARGRAASCPPRVAFVLLVLLTLGVGCRAGLYSLPSPPPAEKQRDVSLIPGEEQRQAEQLYLDARARVMELNNLLSTNRYQEAVELLSLETRDWLESMGGGAPAAEVMAAGKLKLPSGEVVEFDPVSTLLAGDVSKLTDAIDGVDEHETENRKEIFATLPSGKIQKVVLISEGGQWVLHRTRLPEPFDPPK